MSDAASIRTTQLIERAAGGDGPATDELLAVVYDELRRMAQAQMGREQPGQTLQPTALVHEAYLRLLGGGNGGGGGDVQWNSRGHFFGAAAQAMRRILVERARARGRQKRGGARERIELDPELDAMSNEPDTETMIDIDDVLKKLESFDKQKAMIVMLRYFAGLSLEQTAAALEVTLATVRAEWAYARAWMHREMSG
jgi:RNA polymerase sigma factor (TIGR02999 family)